MDNNNRPLFSRTLKVSANELPELIDLCQRSKNSLLVIGNPGTGKSTIIKGMEQQGYKVTMLTGSSTYEETVNGIPYRDTSNKSITGNDLQVYNVPDWLEQVVNYKGKQALFIDEWNTADAQVLKTFLSVMTERKVPTQPDALKLPDDCVIIAAMNPAEQNDGEQMIRPFKSRFMVVELVSTIEDFKSYIVANHNSTTIKDDDVSYLIDAVDKDRWGVEGTYTELCPRSFTNFIRALDTEVTNGGDAHKLCPRLSMAFFGQVIEFPTEETVKAQEEQKKQEQIKKNPYPTKEELEQLASVDLKALYNKMVTKGNKKSDQVCIDINDILNKRDQDEQA